jgi:hypothetical protein
VLLATIWRINDRNRNQMTTLLASLQRSSYANFRLRLLLGFGFLVTLLLVFMCWKTYSGYQSDRNTALGQTKSFSQAMGAHVSSQIAVIDLTLVHVAESIAKLEAETPPSPVEPSCAAVAYWRSNTLLTCASSVSPGAAT